MLNPIIEIHDADNASGQWRLIMPCTVNTPDGPEARWLLSAYAEEYSRVDGVWLFRSLVLTVNFYAPHLAGWA